MRGRGNGSAEEELTPREREVLGLVADGLTNREIGERLAMSENAVRFHLKRLHAKLSTESDRTILARSGGHSLRGLAGLVFGRFGVAASVGIFGVAIGGLAIAAYVAYPGNQEADAAAPIVDGLYPNGCPAEFAAGTMTLSDFAAGFHSSIDALKALNPNLDDGPLPPDTAVRVPYDPMGQCLELEPTPPGARPVPGGTPASAHR